MFHHVKLNSAMFTYFGFALENEGNLQYYQFKILQFGNAYAVYCVTKLLKTVSVYMHSQSILFSIFIDDIRILNRDKKLCELETIFCTKILAWAGWNVNHKKSILEPTQQLLYLGFFTDTINMMYFSPVKKLLVICDLINEALKKDKITKREMATILGKIASRKKSHGNIVQVMTRHCQHILGKAVHVNDIQDWEGFVVLDNHAKIELNYFLTNIVEFNGRKIQTCKTPLHVIYPNEKLYYTEVEHYNPNSEEMYICSDSSESHSFLYEMEKFNFIHEFKFSEEESQSSSGYRELLSVIKFTELYKPMNVKSNIVIYWLTDSQNLYSFLKKGSRKLYIQEKILMIKKFEANHGVVIIPVWAPREDENLVLADLGSKFEKSTDEWSIDSNSYLEICKYFEHKPTIDCFASTKNRKCKRFFSKIPQEGSIGINFFVQQLEINEIYWICPPPHLIIDVIKLLSSYRCNLTVILFIPLWKNSNFWPFIVKNKIFHPIIKKFKICKPKFTPNNSTQNVFDGVKNFQCLAFLIKTKEENEIVCPI